MGLRFKLTRRFGLRALFVLFAFLAVLMAWARSYIDYADQRWNALSHLGHDWKAGPRRGTPLARRVPSMDLWQTLFRRHATG